MIAIPPACRSCGEPADGRWRGVPLCAECLALRRSAGRLEFHRGTAEPDPAHFSSWAWSASVLLCLAVWFVLWVIL